MPSEYKIEDFKVLKEAWQEAAEERASKTKFCCTDETVEYAFLSPKSELRGYWTLLLLCVIIYNTVFIPMRTTFPHMNNPALWYPIDYFGDLILIVDIFWRFHVGYYALGVVVTTRRLVVRNYLRGTFVIDLLASMPFDFAHYEDPQVHAFLRLNRVLRLYHVPAIFRTWENATSRPVVFRLSKLFFGIMILAHWTACAFFAVVKQENRKFDGDWSHVGEGGGWPQGLQDYLNAPTLRAYSRSLFWCITLMTGMGPDHNMPDTDVELAFSFLMLFIGIFVFASVIGNVGDLISNRNATSAKFRKKLDIVNLWMRYKGIRADLQHRIRNYYQYIWQRQAGLNDSIILSDLPLHLRADVSSDLNKDILRKVSLFEKCGDESFLQALTRKLKPEVYTPNDYIIREGDFGQSMFFITRGIVTVELEGVGKVNTLGEGSFFGEVALLMKAKRNASIIAKTFVDVFVLTKDDVDEALEDFPEYAMEIYLMAMDLGAEDQNKDIKIEKNVDQQLTFGDTESPGPPQHNVSPPNGMASPPPIVGGTPSVRRPARAHHQASHSIQIGTEPQPAPPARSRTGAHPPSGHVMAADADTLAIADQSGSPWFAAINALKGQHPAMQQLHPEELDAAYHELMGLVQQLIILKAGASPNGAIVSRPPTRTRARDRNKDRERLQRRQSEAIAPTATALPNSVPTASPTTASPAARGRSGGGNITSMVLQ